MKKIDRIFIIVGISIFSIIIIVYFILPIFRVVNYSEYGFGRTRTRSYSFNSFLKGSVENYILRDIYLNNTDTIGYYTVNKTTKMIAWKHDKIQKVDYIISCDYRISNGNLDYELSTSSVINGFRSFNDKLVNELSIELEPKEEISNFFISNSNNKFNKYNSDKFYSYRFFSTKFGIGFSNKLWAIYEIDTGLSQFGIDCEEREFECGIIKTEQGIFIVNYL